MESPLLDYIKNHLTHSAILMHKEVINDIRKFRGSVLKGTDLELFEGLIFTGLEGKKLGL